MIDGMTNDKFRRLCEQVLIPLLGNLIYRHLTTVHEDIDAVARELARVSNRLDTLAQALERDRGT